jgi:ribonuclease HI
VKQIQIYTDGACSGNPGPGGWGAILIYNGVEKTLSGFAPKTTNQRMELTAAVEALKALKEPCQIKLHSDSAYLINAFRQNWIGKWLANGWQNAQKKPVENQDLWQELITLSRIQQVEWIKVPGHQDNIYNNRCDSIAREAISKNQTSKAEAKK